MPAAVDKDSCFSNYQAITSKTFAISLLCEFIGVMVFTFLGSTVSDKVFGPWVNGLALAIWIYAAANVSGGHLNPAVTFSTLICGFYPLLHSILYIILQIVGAMFGSMLVAGLVPGVYVGMGDGAPGCFDPTVVGKGLTHSQLFGWEVVMTFTLISVVYACGVAKPGHGSFTPLVVGLSLVACAGTGGKWTGAALNPARVLGPLAVFRCGRGIAYIYVLAQLLAAILACAIFSFVSGWGPLSPLFSMKELGLSYPEAMMMWITGSPPKRFQTDGDENITDVLQEHARESAAGEARSSGGGKGLSGGGKGLSGGGKALDSQA
ncbi:Nodulin-26 [Scenedesmus sp. PABB004]|nr:Nodulin-26 [Scenedesmus sp. PABB004]